MDRSLLTPLQVAERWKVTTKTLSQWRYYGRGPKYSKVSRIINYWLPDIERFEQSRCCRSTSEYQALNSERDDQTDQSKEDTSTILVFNTGRTRK